MRRIVLSMALLLGGGMQPDSLQAGVYNLDPPRKYPSDYIESHAPQPLELVTSYIFELRAIKDTPVNLQQPPVRGSLRESYLKQLAHLEQKRNVGLLDVADRINLGACLIRLGRDTKAQEFLEESLHLVPPDSSLRFLLLLNLAAVCQEDDSLLQRALQSQREALRSWPALVPGWNRNESTWFRHVEQYVLTMMELRNREVVLRGGRPVRDQLSPDRLFPREEHDLAKKVQFVGESGEYEAGGIAWSQFDRLPADSDQVVLQLLLWRPNDTRLLWLYGELQNARGKVDWALFLLNEKVRENDLWRNRELDRHIRVLKDALTPYRELFVDSTGSGAGRRKQALLLWSLMPRGALLAPAIGVASSEIAGVAVSADPAALSGVPQPPEANGTRGTDASPSGAALPDWRQLTVSFVTGVVVTVLGMMQWKQWRHRRIVSREPSSAAEHYAPK